MFTIPWDVECFGVLAANRQTSNRLHNAWNAVHAIANEIPDRREIVSFRDGDYVARTGDRVYRCHKRHAFQRLGYFVGLTNSCFDEDISTRCQLTSPLLIGTDCRNRMLSQSKMSKPTNVCQTW